MLDIQVLLKSDDLHNPCKKCLKKESNLSIGLMQLKWIVCVREQEVTQAYAEQVSICHVHI